MPTFVGISNQVNECVEVISNVPINTKTCTEKPCGAMDLGGCPLESRRLGQQTGGSRPTSHSSKRTGPRSLPSRSSESACSATDLSPQAMPDADRGPLEAVISAPQQAPASKGGGGTYFSDRRGCRGESAARRIAIRLQRFRSKSTG